MNRSRGISLSLLALLLLLGGCATRPVNPPIKEVDANAGYTFQTRQKHFKSQENLVILAFSGGGTRAAAFSYGVLEFLRRTEVTTPKGKGRLLDAVDVITGVSGGSFTALAYGLYGDKLFADYEQRFLKRDVQGELLARALSPGNWGNLSSTAGAAPNWRRSSTTRSCSTVRPTATSTAATARSSWCRPPTSRPAAGWSSTRTSSTSCVRISMPCGCPARPPHLRPCRSCCRPSRSTTTAAPATTPSRPGSSCLPDPRIRRGRQRARYEELKDAEPYADSVHHPYIHLVDGGVADNVGMRGVLDALEFLEALHDAGQPTPLDRVKRIIVFVVNSLSSPPTNWDESESPPGTVDILLKATGVPIDHYSYEAVELLKDIASRWEKDRNTRDLAGCSTNKDSPVCAAIRVPQAEIYAIDVSFAALPDAKEREYLNQQPTSFVLPPEAVDRLRAAAGTIILASPEFQRLLKDVGAKVVADPSAGGSAAAGASLNSSAAQ